LCYVCIVFALFPFLAFLLEIFFFLQEVNTHLDKEIGCGQHTTGYKTSPFS